MDAETATEARAMAGLFISFEREGFFDPELHATLEQGCAAPLIGLNRKALSDPAALDRAMERVRAAAKVAGGALIVAVEGTARVGRRELAFRLPQGRLFTGRRLRELLDAAGAERTLLILDATVIRDGAPADLLAAYRSALEATFDGAGIVCLARRPDDANLFAPRLAAALADLAAAGRETAPLEALLARLPSPGAAPLRAPVDRAFDVPLLGFGALAARTAAAAETAGAAETAEARAEMPATTEEQAATAETETAADETPAAAPAPADPLDAGRRALEKLKPILPSPTLSPSRGGGPRAGTAARPANRIKGFGAAPGSGGPLLSPAPEAIVGAAAAENAPLGGAATRPRARIAPPSSAPMNAADASQPAADGGPLSRMEKAVKALLHHNAPKRMAVWSDYEVEVAVSKDLTGAAAAGLGEAVTTEAIQATGLMAVRLVDEKNAFELRAHSQQIQDIDFTTGKALGLAGDGGPARGLWRFTVTPKRVGAHRLSVEASCYVRGADGVPVMVPAAVNLVPVQVRVNLGLGIKRLLGWLFIGIAGVLVFKFGVEAPLEQAMGDGGWPALIEKLTGER